MKKERKRNLSWNPLQSQDDATFSRDSHDPSWSPPLTRSTFHSDYGAPKLITYCAPFQVLLIGEHGSSTIALAMARLYIEQAPFTVAYQQKTQSVATTLRCDRITDGLVSWHLSLTTMKYWPFAHAYPMGFSPYPKDVACTQHILVERMRHFRFAGDSWNCL